MKNMRPDVMKPVIVLGAGGHAKVLIEALILSGNEIMGVTAPDLKKSTNYFDATVS